MAGQDAAGEETANRDSDRPYKEWKSDCGDREITSNPRGGG